MRQKLKPCPFCGGSVNLSQYSTNKVIIECRNPYCYTTVCVVGDSPEWVIKTWNTRAEGETKCNNCGLKFAGTSFFNYCPNCGASMREGD